MKLIQLTQGPVTMVDDDIFEELNKFKWQAHWYHNSFRAVRTIRTDGKKKALLMHRFIISAQKGDIVDHIDGNPLNNQRNNLRFCTLSQNQHNSKMRSDSTTGFKGVSRNGKGFRAQIMLNGQPIRLGTRSTPEEAHELYKEASEKYHGEFGRVE